MRSRTCLVRRGDRGVMTAYQLTDRPHDGRTAHVSADGIASTVSAWLAELGAYGPLVEDLARTVCNGDWPAAHAIAEHLSVGCRLDMAEFFRNSDAFVWSIEGDPRLRSTIVTLVLLDRNPNWEQVVDRFELLSRTMPMFRQRVMLSPPPAPPRWEVDPDFDLAFHLRRVTAPEPGTVDTLLEMARLAAMADFDRARPLWEATVIDGLADGGARCCAS